ncbi:MAG: xanthine dehydrogenase family protein subunit M [Deltaproteobacteria bacterium]|nr:xanthine dehydrogenase family protein subunit M [Deltaproteobacteria bacterium]
MRQVWLPTSLEELWELWEAHPEAALYAGGTDLLVRLRAGLAAPPSLICLERLAELATVRRQGAGLRLGALATPAALLENPLVQEAAPVLTQALAELGSPPIRHMGTLGGNLGTASPAGDCLPPLYVLEAAVELCSRQGARVLPLAEFIQGPGRTALAPGEIIAAVLLPGGEPWSRNHFVKVGRRRALAIAVASLAAVARQDAGGRVTEIRLAWGSVGPTVVRAPRVEQALRGGRLDQASLTAVLPLVQEAVSPIDDGRASAAHRRRLAGNLLLALGDL